MSKGEDMELRECDVWYRVELYQRGRWVAAPSPVDDSRSADFDTEEDAHAYAHARYPGLMRSAFRAPVRGQWRVSKVRGQRHDCRAESRGVTRTLGCEFRRLDGRVVPLIRGPHDAHDWTRHGVTVHCDGTS